MEENAKKFNGILQKILHIGASEITDGLILETLASWDSFNSLTLVTELEKAFSMRFTMDQVTSAKKVGDFKEGLRKNGISL